ncbi:MAG: hypothetical protein ACPG4U_15180 [Pseudomonadales bacterium]
MSKKHGKHSERHENLNYFGKELVRRCAAHCELCASAGVSLSIFEVSPVPKEPDIAHCLMICEACESALAKPKKMDANHWRCLSTTMWSEVEAAKVTAIVVLNYLAKQHAWAQEYLEQAYLEDEQQAWVDAWQLDAK